MTFKKISKDNNVHSWNKWEKRAVTLAPQGRFLHSGICSSRSQRSSLCLGRFHFLFCRLYLGVTAHFATFIWQPLAFLVTVQLLTPTGALCAELLYVCLLAYGGCDFHRRGPLMVFSDPAVERAGWWRWLFLTFPLLLSQSQMDGPGKLWLTERHLGREQMWLTH